MTDRELLDMAAKAAELTLWEYSESDEGLFIHDDKLIKVWNPLINDGDALRLAVKLELFVAPHGRGTYVAGEIPFLREEYDDDPYAATRRAIVRAAAEIGKGME